MRVLHVFDHSVPLHSGYGFRSLNILREQRALGVETIQLTGGKHPADAAEEQVDDLLFHRTPEPSGLLLRLPAGDQAAVVLDLSRRIVEVAKATGAQLIHAYSPCLNGLAALRAASVLGVPMVYELRTLWEDAAVAHGKTTATSIRYRLSQAMETFVLRRADHVFPICEGLRGEAVARGTPPARITVVGNGIVADKFAGLQADQDLLPEHLRGRRIIAFIGSFWGYEGLEVLVRAFAQLDRADAALVLVGGGPEAEPLQALAAQLGVADDVLFTGRVPNDQVQHWYGLGEIFVYPRLETRLTRLVTPLKPLEAMASGRLVLASDIGGHRELVDDGETGVLFPAGSVVGLADCLGTALDGGYPVAELTAAARVQVEANRSWANMVARYLPVYERLLAE